jgi:ectoine hydroxylase-related dioxygenase (phytanoyl-CoA dioxygenase family)
MIDRDGYSIHHDVFASAEMLDVLRALADADVSRTRAGARHVLHVPAVRAIAHDDRMLALARDYLGEPPIPFRATLFDKSAAANWLVVWHQDTALPIVERVDAPDWGPWSIKAGTLYAMAPAAALCRVVALRVHLDESAEDNGPLRVLPCTHHRGVLQAADIQAAAVAIRPVTCVVPAGGVVGMRPLIVHASSKAVSDQPRRVLHIEYSASVNFGDGIRLAVA